MSLSVSKKLLPLSASELALKLRILPQDVMKTTPGQHYILTQAHPALSLTVSSQTKLNLQVNFKYATITTPPPQYSAVANL